MQILDTEGAEGGGGKPFPPVADCGLAEKVERGRFRVMSAAKDEAVELIKRLPEDATMEDIQHHLYVLEKIKQGQNRIVAEGGISQETMERDMAKWILS